MYKVYDAEENAFFDIRDESGVTIDSETYYNKKQRRKFSVLPLAKTLVKNLWTIFWVKKDKSNKGLIKAAQTGDTKKVIKLLNKLREPEKVADINYCNEKGFTALHTAAKYNQYECMRLILTTGDANINMPTLDGLHQTALHIATIEQHMLLVKLLLQEFYASVNSLDSKLNTPLHYAIQT